MLQKEIAVIVPEMPKNDGLGMQIVSEEVKEREKPEKKSEENKKEEAKEDQVAEGDAGTSGTKSTVDSNIGKVSINVRFNKSKLYCIT